MQIGRVTMFSLIIATSIACIGIGDAQAQSTVAIYYCTDSNGHLTVQNGKPCPKGHRQKKTMMEVAAPGPAPVHAAPEMPPVPATALTPATAPTHDATTAATLNNTDATPAKPAPPALFECVRRDEHRYFSDVGDPPAQCFKLTTTGIGDNPEIGAGEACEMVSDVCTPIADAALCDAWKQRVRESLAAWKFGDGENARERKAEYERVNAILAGSSCTP